MTARQWTAQTTLLIFQYGTIPKLTDEKQWRAWADYVASLPAMASVGSPRSAGFKSWQDWASAFNQQIRNLGI